MLYVVKQMWINILNLTNHNLITSSNNQIIKRYDWSLQTLHVSRKKMSHTECLPSPLSKHPCAGGKTFSIHFPWDPLLSICGDWSWDQLFDRRRPHHAAAANYTFLWSTWRRTTQLFVTQWLRLCWLHQTPPLCFVAALDLARLHPNPRLKTESAFTNARDRYRSKTSVWSACFETTRRSPPTAYWPLNLTGTKYTANSLTTQPQSLLRKI